MGELHHAKRPFGSERAGTGSLAAVERGQGGEDGEFEYDGGDGVYGDDAVWRAGNAI